MNTTVILRTWISSLLLIGLLSGTFHADDLIRKQITSYILHLDFFKARELTKQMVSENSTNQSGASEQWTKQVSKEHISGCVMVHQNYPLPLLSLMSVILLDDTPIFPSAPLHFWQPPKV